MSSIANLFSNLNDLVKPKSVTDNVTDYNKNNPTPISLSLNQGRKFKKYQKQINASSILLQVKKFHTNVQRH
jgi:hypothetical protein